MTYQSVMKELFRSERHYRTMYFKGFRKNEAANRLASLRLACQEASQWLEHGALNPTQRGLLKLTLTQAEKLIPKN